MSNNKKSNEDNGGSAEELIHRDDPKKKKQRGEGKKIRKAKQVVLFPFRKVNKKLCKDNNNNNKRSSSSSANSSKYGCYLCFMQPLASDSSVSSQARDPNNPNFSYGLLKSLIEKNDFYSRECNVHKTE